MTQCECTMAGYCNRHNVNKHDHWVHLCQTRQDYFDIWEQGIGPGQPKEVVHVPQKYVDPLIYYQLWDEAHQHIPGPNSEAWLRDWLSRIPRTGCGCRRHLRELLDKYPPDFSSLEAWRRTTWEWRNEVRRRKQKPLVSWEEACELHWPSLQE